MLWVYFHCNQLTLDLHSKAQDPAEPQLPTLVYNEQHNRIVQCNSTAKRQGVEVGSGLAHAASLCPDMVVLDYQPEKEKLALITLAHRFYQVASDIVVAPPNGIAVRIDNLLQYYGEYRTLWHTLVNELKAESLHASFGVAWGIQAAKVLAKCKTNHFTSDLKQIKNTLGSCPLSFTDLDEKTYTKLKRVGISSISALLAMPIQELGQRFSNDTIRYLTALRGETFPKVTLFRPHNNFSTTLVLPFEAQSSVQLHPYIHTLLVQLEQYLRARNVLTLAIDFALHFREADILAFTMRSAHPLSRSADWYPLVLLKLDTLTLTQPAIEISLQCEQFETAAVQDGDFFSDRFTLLAQKQLLGRLNAKLGSDRRFQPVSFNDNRFENMTLKAEHATDNTYTSPICPTFLYASPKPLNVASHICFGPVRLQTGWWESNVIERDYFIIETQDSLRLFAYRDKKSQWWVQGMFS